MGMNGSLENFDEQTAIVAFAMTHIDPTGFYDVLVETLAKLPKFGPDRMETISDVRSPTSLVVH